MKFVGGPMHGLPVPDEVDRFTVRGTTEFICVQCFNGGELTAHTYVKTAYWQFDKPLLWYFASVAMPEEDLARLARQVLVG
jgi:hypothetical protein